MFEFFRALFGTDFMPHLYCLRSDPGVIWLEVISDLAIAAAYFAIPLVLFDVVVKRKDLIFRRVAVLFVIFIAACGATHVLSVWTIWVPVYRLEALVKAVTAVASVTTAVVLVQVRPLIFRLPSIRQLEEEIRGRRQAEAEAREREVRFRAFVDSVEDYAIYMLSPQGIVLSWNSGAQRLQGYAAEEIVGRRFSIFFTEEEQASGDPEEILRMALEKGGYEGKGWRVRKDGTRFLANVHLRPLYEDGKLQGFSKVTRDLTESREMEEKHRMLMEAAPDAIVIVNAAGGIDFINTQAEKLFQYERAEVVGKPVDMLVPARTRKAQAVYRDRLMELPQHPQLDAPEEIRGLRKDGSDFPLEFSVSPLDMKEGRLLLFAVRDLTERQRTEARFQALLEAAPDALFITDRAGRIAYMNRRAEEVFGVSRRDVEGRSADLLIPERLRLERSIESEANFLAPKQLQPGYGGEYLCLRGDGTEILVEASRSPLETAEGMVILTSVRDISERKKSEMRFRALLDSAPDAMVISNREGMIELINRQAERVFGYAREEMLGRPVEMLIPADLRGEYGKDSRKFLGGDFEREMGAGLELRARRRDGSEFPVEIRFSPLEGPNGISMTAAIRDISERKLAAQLLAEKMAELRQSNEALEQFAHIASHDLQEPLRMVASFTQLLARRYKGRLDKDADEFIGYAVDGTQRMKRLIEDLLVYSRAGKSAPATRELRSQDALREAIGNLKAAIEECGARVTWDELPKVTASELQLVQLFQNLIGNAIKYRGERVPRIHVAAQTTETEWIFSVADNGIGIEAKYFDRVFVIFHRLHGRGEYEGTGIGLAICKRILQQQGGRIWVESEFGSGSTFYFALPVR
jgi:PAS domain S-box-containing protein